MHLLVGTIAVRQVKQRDTLGKPQGQGETVIRRNLPALPRTAIRERERARSLPFGLNPCRLFRFAGILQSLLVERVPANFIM